MRAIRKEIRTRKKAARREAATIAHRKAMGGVPTEAGKERDEYYADYRGHRTIVPWQSGDTEEEKPAKLKVLIMDPAAGYGQSGLASATDLIPAHTDFFIQTIDETDTEKVHLVETFGGTTWAHMFDRKPRVWVFSGSLINSSNENWTSAFEYLYEHYMRGTKCAETGAQIQLTYEGKSIYGLMLGTSRQYASGSPTSVPFTFSILVNHVELMRTGAVQEDLAALRGPEDEAAPPGEAGAQADGATANYTSETLAEANQMIAEGNIPPALADLDVSEEQLATYLQSFGDAQDTINEINDDLFAASGSTDLADAFWAAGEGAEALDSIADPS
jgi:hypothetical protein